MRSAWKALLLRGIPRRIPGAAGFSPSSLPDLQVQLLFAPNPGSLRRFFAWDALQAPGNRRFSSELAAVKASHPEHSHLIEIFSGPGSSDEIMVRLESAGISMEHGTVNSVIESLDERPEVAWRVFNWVKDREDAILSSKSYNLMLRMLGAEGKSVEFWSMLEAMKKKGYGLSKGTFLKVSKSFDEKGMVKDLGLLKETYKLNSPENYVLRMSARICKVLREGDELGEAVWKELEMLDVSLSFDLVAAILDRLCMYPTKAFMFFRWTDVNPSFKADGKVYNVMARVLGREDCISNFWAVLKEMRDDGHELETETYVEVTKAFHRRKMINEAVNLYEFAMCGSNKPPPEDLSYLLRKVVVCRELDLALISRVMKAVSEAGYIAEHSVYNGVCKSLASVGRLQECVKLLKAMEEGGFVATSVVYDRVVGGLCNARCLDEALCFLSEREDSGNKPDSKTWAYLIQSYCLSGSTEKALSCFHNIVEKKDSENVGYAFDALVNAFTRKNKDVDVCNVLTEMADSGQFQPWHNTYKFLIRRLLSKGKMIEASCLLGLMKRHGFPPFIDPFIDYVSKFGTGEDAMVFLKAMTVKSFPSISVFIRIFEALLRAGRHEVAHDLLSKSPGYVRSHSDVLSLFFSMKSSEEILTAVTA
ncbi:hypothetical protein Taro_052003 [Colocasia esculenta]|uniref:Pentatricopeptide repeat-containing protein n=1 Tax=Colocasia esculenta TaxID=4460 RepID=A0A843XIF2_COLES|nr:hypothetical protein [Colocasia esculenta]